MQYLTEARRPPRPDTAAGTRRRVGVEVEFAAVSARQGARIVCDMFGGAIREEDAHRFHIEDTEFGGFVSELDTQYAHRPHGDGEAGDTDAADGTEAFRTEMRKLFGDISSLVMPCEIVCPPMPFDALPQLDRLVDALTDAGAEGTRASPFYAFGAQFNPEIATDDPEWLTAVLRAYLLLSPWLRAVMSLDLTRRTVSFADPFPKDYVARVLAPGYAPTIPALIDDYLDANPTRNRELDLLPLFAHLDEDRLRARIDDARVKARPTFHYRLPDANIGQADWSLCLEWNRWVVVERLAEDRDLTDKMAADYLAHGGGAPSRRWPLRVSHWLALA